MSFDYDDIRVALQDADGGKLHRTDGRLRTFHSINAALIYAKRHIPRGRVVSAVRISPRKYCIMHGKRVVNFKEGGESGD